MPAFSDLPGELILIILKAPDRLDTTLAIAATCRTARRIWRENCSTIIRYVLQNQISCYAGAMKLAEGQSRPNGLMVEPPSFARRLLANHEEAEFVQKQVEIHGIPLKHSCPNSEHCRSHPPEMLDSEKQRFFHAWYIIRKFTVVFEKDYKRVQGLKDEARQLGLEETLLLAGLMEWIGEHLEYHARVRLGIEIDDPRNSQCDWAIIEAGPMDAPWHFADEVYNCGSFCRFYGDPRVGASYAWARKACTDNPVF